MRLLLLLFLAMAVAGCRYYYTKPGATSATFDADHAACVKEVGKVSADGFRTYVATNDYRGCMQLRGWTRTEKTNPGRDWYRGIEEDGVYSVGTPPENRETLEHMLQMREHCRQTTRGRPAEYQECLRR